MSQPKSYASIGAPKLRLVAVKSAKLPFVASTTCVRCERALTIAYGAVGAVFMIGNEFVGVCCDACLTPDSQARLQAHRRLLREKA